VKKSHIWSIIGARTPADPMERGSMYGVLTAMVKQDIEKGFVKDY
jgi:hypothetical protein